MDLVYNNFRIRIVMESIQYSSKFSQRQSIGMSFELTYRENTITLKMGEDSVE